MKRTLIMRLTPSKDSASIGSFERCDLSDFSLGPEAAGGPEGQAAPESSSPVIPSKPSDFDVSLVIKFNL
jgi:hypothetical protein